MHRALLSAAHRRAQCSAPTAAVRQLGRRKSATQQQQNGQPSPANSTNNDWRSQHNPLVPGSPAHELDQVSNLYEHNFARPTLSSLDFFRRALKLSASLLALIAGTTIAAFEGAHLYVEHKSLAPPADVDGELHRYGWDAEAERWTGGASGGTDPGLGWKARHAVRSAWIAQNWGTGSQVLASGSITSASRDSGPVEAQLELAHDFLNIALAVVLERVSEAAKTGSPSGLNPDTLTDLLQRHASTLERIGSKGALYDARAEYERVYSGLSSTASAGVANAAAERARLALKLGNISARLGEDEEALEWWARALTLASDVDNASSHPVDRKLYEITPTPAVPARLPMSPLAQRTLGATLSSLSAHYAQTGRLQDAKDVQEKGLNLLMSARNDEPNAVSSSSSSLLLQGSGSTTTSSFPSPSKALHDLFLLHRTSLLSLHNAEVSYALRSPSSSHPTPLESLAHAAHLSEQVAFLLTGSPLAHPDAPRSEHIPPPPAPDASLDARFSGTEDGHGSALGRPARSLLRDARRTAVQAWALQGTLLERGAGAGSEGAKSAKTKTKSSTSTPESATRAGKEEALACYERALGWAGVNADEQGGIGQPGEGTLDSEWKALWGSYIRVRDELRKDGKSTSGI